jgi:fructoselysine-6-P-deglycase FrlB-like protein
MAMAYAALREDAGHGLTDAFAGSEFPAGRDYDAVVVISRSGTTTEVLDVIRGTGLPTVAITATPDAPIVALADETVLLDFADEQSVVQTRFATTTLALLRASVGEDLTRAAADAATALTIEVEPLVALEQVTYLGTRWTVGLAHEAGLKQREAASAWTEAYPAMDYRHGPIAIAQPGRGVWIFGPPPPGLLEDVAATGATVVYHPTSTRWPRWWWPSASRSPRPWRSDSTRTGRGASPVRSSSTWARATPPPDPVACRAECHPPKICRSNSI